MKYLRWYDKDPALKEFMWFLENLDSQVIDMLAQDFIQIIMESNFINKDSFINLIDQNSPQKYNRWYDKNYNLHSCIELLKSLPEIQKHLLVDQLKDSCFQFITNIYYEKK